MKRNTMMRLASVLLVAVLLSTCTIAGTYAKYVSDFNPTSSARVAKWAFKIEDETDSNNVEFDLFETIGDTLGGDEADIAVGENGEKLIAPGTSGSFSIDLINESEVTAHYKIKYSAETNGIPIEFSVDGTDGWITDISQLYVTESNPEGYYSPDENMGMTTDTKLAVTPTVYWRWAIGDNDDANANDTTLGENGEATVTITAEIVVEQVD